jgi:hypothetical protein
MSRVRPPSPLYLLPSGAVERLSTRKGCFMADLIATVTSSLANDLFGSLNYPFRMRVDGNMALAKDSGAKDSGSETALAEDSGSEVDIDWLPAKSAEEDHGFEADLEPLLDALIEACLESQSGAPLMASEPDAEAEALVQPYLAGDDTGRAGQIAGVKARMAQDAAFAAKLETFLKARLGAGIDWVEAELSQMPASAMGNPLTLSNLRLAVRARARACIRIFGRKICVSATSPWIRFEGRRAALFLDVVGTKIFGRAQLSDLDFVMTIRILGRNIKIRIGVTGLVNRQLARQRPLLADFGNVRITVPGVGRVYQPSTVTVPASSTETRLELDGGFSPA